MKAIKEIISTQKVDIDIEDVTILSAEEYEMAKDVIPPIHMWWWLRSPGSIQGYAAYVSYGGSLSLSSVHLGGGCVRPALRIKNLKSSNLLLGERFSLARKTWTVVLDDMAICNDTVGKTCFRENWKADDANDYSASDLKKWVDEWAKKKGLKQHNSDAEIKMRESDSIV